MTDRQIALASLAVAAVGAVAALAVVPEFRCWVLHDGCSSSGSPAGVAAIPTLLGLTGFVAFFLLRRAQGNDQIVLSIIEKVRRSAPDLFADRLETMSPSALSKTIEGNIHLRTQVGEHDFQLLKAALQNQFIIALVVYGLCGFCFVVGAILYFLLQPPPLIGQRLIFRSDVGDQAAVTGTAEAIYDAEKRSASFKNATDIVIGGIASTQIGKPFTLTLASDDYELRDGLNSQLTFSKDPIFVPLKLKDVPPYAGSVFVGDDPAPAAKVALFGLPCRTTTQDSGYFEFRDCLQARRLEAAKLQLTLPSMTSACPNPFPLLPPPKLTAIKVNADCSRFEIGVMACAACKPNFVNEPHDELLCHRAVIGELLRRLPQDTRNRWLRDPGTPAEGCTVTCHVYINGGVVRTQPGGRSLIFRAPGPCTDGEFVIDAGQFFAQDLSPSATDPPDREDRGRPR